MANLMTSFYTGVSGLHSAQASLNTTSHNLANAQTKGYVRQASIINATQILDNTAARITDIMGKVEGAADSVAWLMSGQLTPEALISETREILERDSQFYSCSISLEPCNS